MQNNDNNSDGNFSYEDFTVMKLMEEIVEFD